MREKTEEISHNEEIFNQELSKVYQKVENLETQIQKSSEYERIINDLNSVLRQKEKELENQKKCFAENEKNRKHLQKNEWGKIYNELLEEIKQLKEEIDLLGFENKKLLESTRVDKSLDNSLQISDVMFSNGCKFTKRFIN